MDSGRQRSGIMGVRGARRQDLSFELVLIKKQGMFFAQGSICCTMLIMKSSIKIRGKISGCLCLYLWLPSGYRCSIMLEEAPSTERRCQGHGDHGFQGGFNHTQPLRRISWEELWETGVYIQFLYDILSDVRICRPCVRGKCIILTRVSFARFSAWFYRH